MTPPSSITMVGHIGNLVAISLLLLVIPNMPLDISSYIKEEDIGHTVSPEDYTSLWSWMSFRWVLPLVERGTYNTLNESDIWALSPMMQSCPLYIKFTCTHHSTLLQWLIVFNYAGPFFLKRILNSLDVCDEQSHEERSLAYIYAVLAFLSKVCKAQVDVQHLWFSRHAATRIRSELMVAIYDKALKRKDFSEIVDKDASKAAKAPDATDISKAKAGAKADNPKVSADIGKIVNLMAGDTNKMIYGVPFEIAIAATFLYQ
ncbi:uncharacterized protein LAESUDRAFT_758644 [Laetiporus sulphureus 93-53]|uniref:ABC transmembrane type-1 domain-containing protein n=1 Tax=Laetiporus sulphureus 93-53 TaxID=1314785 RepID=A0A165EKE6_9APHY|nr:uncharacterized protein LAESUDRAFT_758644 [Laetiporus sulphureus 93-53]KZT07241.1 hypothetical protein LAESUDRAFT_758644 [Laetiporus sulphureus 93-53]